MGGDPINLHLYGLFIYLFLDDNFHTLIAATQPFRVGVHFDGDEYLTGANSDLTTAAIATIDDEFKDAPAGIIGMRS